MGVFPLSHFAVRKSKWILTERVVFLQWSIYFPIWLNLQMIFSSAVKLSAPRSSSEVFIHSSASPGVPALPVVASLVRDAAGSGTNGIQQAQQHQQRYHRHRVMAGEQLLRRKNGELLPGSPAPIKVSGLQRSRDRARRTSEHETRGGQRRRARGGSRSAPLLLPLEIFLRVTDYSAPQTERRYKRSLWWQ